MARRPAPRQKPRLFHQRANRPARAGAGPSRCSTRCHTRAGGASGRADSASRLRRSSQSCTRSRRAVSPASRRSKRRRAAPRRVPRAYSAASRSRSSGCSYFMAPRTSWFHASLEADQAAPDPALHRAERGLESARHLLEGQALIVGQQQALARAVLELVEAAAQALGIAAERGQRRRIGAGVLPVLHGALVERGFAAAPAQGIEALVAHDAAEPCHGGAPTGVEAAGVAPDQDERILHDILGQVATTENTEREAE